MDIDAQVGTLLKLPKDFRCPKCGSSYFGSGDTQPFCHDQYERGCKWHGSWDEVAHPEYSTDINWAWVARDAMVAAGFSLFYVKQMHAESWLAHFYNETEHYGGTGQAETAPLAICLAIVDAFEVPE